MGRIVCNIPLNRVEGDLEIKVAIENGAVADAWSVATMFRGFERFLVGRGALDGLVVTPRICGICSTTHLAAAAYALDDVAGIRPPPNALRHRNLALAAEQVQSDIRQSVLMFLPDFVGEAYRDRPWHAEAEARYAPFRGARVIDVVQQTKRMLEVIAILGGQWPHSSFMVPGGVAFRPGPTELLDLRQVIAQQRRWYERRVLGCRCEHWLELDGAEALERWLQDPAHRESDAGWLIRLCKETGLDALGGHYDSYLSYGSLPAPEPPEQTFIPAGFLAQGAVHPLDQRLVAEQVPYSWYADYAGGLHPAEGVTEPFASGSERGKYSMSKAPRYDGRPAETGPLAERLIAGDSLFADLTRSGGNVLARQLARLVRPAAIIPQMEHWVEQLLADPKGSYYQSPGEMPDGQGYGLIEASRGALGHWIRIEAGRIAHYQVITPTAWNGSPRDEEDRRGPWEEALVGIPVKDPENPVEIGHIVRSFDPCLVCTVHRLGDREPWLRL